MFHAVTGGGVGDGDGVVGGGDVVVVVAVVVEGAFAVVCCGSLFSLSFYCWLWW